MYSISPYLWPAISSLLLFLSKKRSFVPPGTEGVDSAIILVHNLQKGQRVGDSGLDFTDAVENWLTQSLGFEKILVVDSLEKAPNLDSRTILVISYDWLFSGRRWRGLFQEIRQLAREARERNLPVWVMLADVYDQGSIIPSSILVSLCGGAIILQPNTAAEARKFGLVFPSGPHIWTMPLKNLKQFKSKTAWADREKIVLLPSGGEVRRIVLMEGVAKRFSKLGWKIQSTNKTFAWDEYVNVVKNTKILVTACWLQEQFIVGSRKTKKRMSSNTVTHRVWEGFAAGCTVVTNSNAVFDELGFISGVHYVELWSEAELNGDFPLPIDCDLEKIASAGHELFTILASGKKQ